MRVTSVYFLNICIYIILLYKGHERVATPSSSFLIHIYLSLEMYLFTLLQLTIIIHYFLHPNGDWHRIVQSSSRNILFCYTQKKCITELSHELAIVRLLCQNNFVLLFLRTFCLQNRITSRLYGYRNESCTKCTQHKILRYFPFEHEKCSQQNRLHTWSSRWYSHYLSYWNAFRQYCRFSFNSVSGIRSANTSRQVSKWRRRHAIYV